MKQELPKGFQTAEFQLEHGFVDKIVKRTKMKTGGLKVPSSGIALEQLDLLF